MANHTDLLFLKFLNKLGFFTKFVKNSIIFIISDTFTFETHHIISKDITMLFYTLFIKYYKYCSKL